MNKLKYITLQDAIKHAKEIIDYIVYISSPLEKRTIHKCKKCRRNINF